MAAINNSGTFNVNADTIQTLSFNNTGVVNITSGTWEVATTLSGSGGIINISQNGTMQLDSVASGNTIVFGDATAGLTIEQLSLYGASMRIVGLQAGDTIAIPHLPTGFKEIYNPNTGTLTLTTAIGSVLGTIIFGGAQLPSTTVVQNAVVLCFAAGTRIATPTGEAAAEALKPGDLVRLRDGTVAEIRWVGGRTLDCRRHPHPEQIRPYRVAAHAFGPDQPRRELRLSPDHAVFVDGVLIPVKYLDNGTTIRQLNVRTVSYHHIELREHAIIEAEGMPVESLLPGSDKTAYPSDGTMVQLHPNFSVRNWDLMGCAPLVMTGPTLKRVRRRLSRRAAAPRGGRLRSSAG